jgi:hypothetical protein
MMGNMAEKVGAYLFADRATNVFAVLDGASVPGLQEKLYQLKPEYECLYRGELKPDMAEVAPYLVRLEAGSGLAEWVVGEGWGNHWGVFALSGGDLRALRQHLRRFLLAYDEGGNPMYFRYYDPRVLRTYLPTCKSQEAAAMFGPVTAYVMEAEEPKKALRFRMERGVLVRSEDELAPA